MKLLKDIKKFIDTGEGKCENLVTFIENTLKKGLDDNKSTHNLILTGRRSRVRDSRNMKELGRSYRKGRKILASLKILRMKKNLPRIHKT